MEILQRVTSADGTRIHYRKSGRGRPLVLVHGITTDHMSWGGLLPYLEPHHTVYAVEERAATRLITTSCVRRRIWPRSWRQSVNRPTCLATSSAGSAR